MKYILLIHQGAAPTPRDGEAWARLSEDEQNAVYADYRRSTRRRAYPRAPDGEPGDGDHSPGRGRQDADHRRAVRRRQGGARRLLVFEADDLDAAIELARASRRLASAARSRCVRSLSGSSARAGLPRRVGAHPRQPDRLPRRLRARRGGRPGGVRRRRRALASRRDAGQPARLAGDHARNRAIDRIRRDRAARGEDPPARCAGAHGG